MSWVGAGMGFLKLILFRFQQYRFVSDGNRTVRFHRQDGSIQVAPRDVLWFWRVVGGRRHAIKPDYAAAIAPVVFAEVASPTLSRNLARATAFLSEDRAQQPVSNLLIG